MKPPPHPELMTKEAAARYLNIKQRTLDDWRVEGLVPVIQIGSRFLRFKKSDLDELLERHYVPARVMVRPVEESNGRMGQVARQHANANRSRTP